MYQSAGMWAEAWLQCVGEFLCLWHARETQEKGSRPAARPGSSFPLGSKEADRGPALQMQMPNGGPGVRKRALPTNQILRFWRCFVGVGFSS